MTTPAFSDASIKLPNVSGQFYSADPKELSQDIENMMGKVSIKGVDFPVDILIVPHAGYVYSGGVAAHGFKSLQSQSYRTIIVLAPSHYVRFDGMAVWAKGGLQTPLGVVAVDEIMAEALIHKNPYVQSFPKAFDKEHALEVEIPFLQKTFKDFQVVPIIMGQPRWETLQQFAKDLKEVIGDRRDVLLVVSTDLSHFHDDATARQMDDQAMEAIKEFKAKEIFEGCQEQTMEMCGCIPVTAALLYAQEKGLTQSSVLTYANSGDVSGDRDRVVGYTSILIHGPSLKKQDSLVTLSRAQKRQLLTIAQETIEAYVLEGRTYQIPSHEERLRLSEGAFVTIHKNGQLRGCIGHIMGQGPLDELVRDMAMAAASSDPRFSPVTPEELKALDIEVSVLSQPQKVTHVDDIQLGRHGVIVRRGFSHYGVFLPQVADETGWSKEEFLSQLCVQKAGLPADAWKDPQTTLEIFTADVFSWTDVQ